MADGPVKVLTFVQVAASHHHLVRETSVVTESREAVRIRQALNMKMNGNFNQNFPTPQTWDYKLLRSMSSPLSSSSSTSWAPTPRLASAHWWRGPKPRQAPAPSPLFRPCWSRFTLLATPTVVGVVVDDVFENVFVAAIDVHLVKLKPPYLPPFEHQSSSTPETLHKHETFYFFTCSTIFRWSPSLSDCRSFRVLCQLRKISLLSEKLLYLEFCNISN